MDNTNTMSNFMMIVAVIAGPILAVQAQKFIEFFTPSWQLEPLF